VLETKKNRQARQARQDFSGTRGDACDPNPCNRPGIGGSFPNPDPADVTGDYWTTFTYDPQILPNSQSPQYPKTQGTFANKYTGTPVATVGARYCPCSDALEHDALKCQDECPIDAGLYDVASFWTEAKVVATPFAGGGPAPAFLPKFPSPSYFDNNAPNGELPNLPLEAPPKTLFVGSDNLADWVGASSWVSWDVTQNGASDVGLVPGVEGSGFGLIGVLWTAVRNVPQAPAAHP
jgi:hypothetical protein